MRLLGAEITATELMVLPFLECLVLVGIHSYLGLHVIRRQVIFVDLSLAQIAALGTTVGFLLGVHPHGPGAFLFSLSFTFLGAAIFALTRTRREQVPQEAIIGIVYAVASAVTILIIAYAPHGAEHIAKVLTGDILNVRREEVLHAAAAYLVVGGFHYAFRHRFLAITEDAEAARAQGIHVPLWDFLFYMSFGFVITFSVDVAGVLLVFVFLVVPAVIATAITPDFRKQLLIGWGLGTAVSVVGLAMAYRLDKPSGPTVVAVYGAVLLIVALVLHVVRSARPARALGHIGLGVLALALIVAYFAGLRRLVFAIPGWAEGDLAQARVTAPRRHRRSAVEAFDAQDVEAKARATRQMRDLSQIEAFFHKATTAEGRLKLAERAAQLDPAAGAHLLLHVFDSSDPVFWRNEALERLAKLCQERFDLDLLEATPDQVRNLVARLRRCVSRLDAARAARRGGQGRAHSLPGPARHGHVPTPSRAEPRPPAPGPGAVRPDPTRPLFPSPNPPAPR